MKNEKLTRKEIIDNRLKQAGWQVDIQAITGRNYDLDIKKPGKQEEEIRYSSAELMEMLEKSFVKSYDLLKKFKAAVK